MPGAVLKLPSRCGVIKILIPGCSGQWVWHGEGVPSDLAGLPHWTVSKCFVMKARQH